MRSFSFTSRSIRNCPALLLRLRSSSSSASKPLAITPPSRITTGGSSSKALSSRSSSSGNCEISSASGERQRLASLFSGELSCAAVSAACSAGSCASPSRSLARSRGRAERRPRRARMRSRSPIPLRICAMASKLNSFMRAATRSWRAVKMAVSRRGRLIQRPRRRPPMAVEVVSNTESSVFSRPPERLVSSSRLRRLAASSTTLSSSCSTLKP